MQFSLLNAVRNHPAHPYGISDLYADYIGDALLAEGLGFIRSWYGEHHFRECQWTGSPLMVGTAVAAQTTTLRIGTAVALLPFHDPRRLAEDVAIADAISNGRVDFGIGPGSQFEEFRSFGIDPATMNGRMWESIDWIMQAFGSTGEFSHQGRYYSIPNMTFTTKPVQDPVPVWYGGMGPKNRRRAAERGFHLVGGSRAGYDDELLAAGRDPADCDFASMQMVCVADSTDAAWGLAAEGLEYFFNFYAQRRDRSGKPADPADRVTIDMLRAGTAKMGTAAVGTPDDVIAALTPAVSGRLGRVTELACAFRHPGMATQDVQKSMNLFVEHVVPALDAVAAQAARDR